MNLQKHTVLAICISIVFATTFTYAESIAPAEYKGPKHLEPGQQHIYTFTENVGATVTILMGEISGEAGFYPKLELRAPDGNIVEDWDISSATIEAYPLPVCGGYSITARDRDGTHSGDYGLTMIQNPGSTTHPTDANGGYIEPGQTVTGTIFEGDLDAFTFSARAGDTVTILMGEISGHPSFYPQVELHGPDGSVVATNWGNQSATILAQQLSMTGLYFIIVRDRDGCHWGRYGLSVIKNPGPNITDPDGGYMQPGEHKTGTIDVGDLDAFTFSAQAGDTVTILMGEISGQASFYPQVELHGPDGNVVATNWDNESATIQAQQVAMTGLYFIIVRDRDGYHTGTYGVSVIKNPGPNKTDPDGGPIRSEEYKTGAVEVGDLDAFTFWANVGDFVSILMGEISGEAGFYPQVELHTPDGNIVDSDWGISSAAITADLTKTGTYFIVTRDRDGYHWGEYGLSFSRLYVEGTPTISSLSVEPNDVNQGEVITLTADGVADDDGWIVQVDFYRDIDRNGYLDLDGTDQFLGSDSSSAGGWTWSGSVSGTPLAGENRYFARAGDNDDLWSDDVSDVGIIRPLFNGDFNADGGVDFQDYSVIAAHWLEDSCNEPGWCDGTDFDVSGTVTGDDLGSFMQRWLNGVSP